MPQVRTSVPGPKMIVSIAFPCLAPDLPVDIAKNCGGTSPDFLSSLVALAHLMRLFLLKAAHVAAGKCHVAGNPGRPSFPGPGTLWRTWGTRPVPWVLLGRTNFARSTFVKALKWPQLRLHTPRRTFRELLARVARGERIVISRYNTPVAELVPPPKQPKRKFGTGKGKVRILDPLLLRLHDQ